MPLTTQDERAPVRYHEANGKVLPSTNSPTPRVIGVIDGKDQYDGKADLSVTESKTYFPTFSPQSNLCTCHKRLHSNPEVDQSWNVSEAQNYDGFPFLDPDKPDHILC